MSVETSGADPRLNDHERQVWDLVSSAPVRNLWKVEGVSLRTIAKRLWGSAIQDRIFGHAAELAFYFLFSLFPTLLCASSILGLAARSAHQVFERLLGYLALVLPTYALNTVMSVFNEAAVASSSRKITFGLIGAIWSASVGVSACQGTLNAVYRLVERRSYLKARLYAIGLTLVLIVTVTLCLASLFSGDFAAAWLRTCFHSVVLGDSAAVLARVASWVLGTGFLSLTFSFVYYWAPDLRQRLWHWLSPGAAVGLVGWLMASVGFRVYLHFFNTYTITYGSLGAVIILLMWFYITGLMLLFGAVVNSAIEAAAVEARFDESIAPSVLDRPIAPAA